MKRETITRMLNSVDDRYISEAAFPDPVSPRESPERIMHMKKKTDHHPCAGRSADPGAGGRGVCHRSRVSHCGNRKRAFSFCSRRRNEKGTPGDRLALSYVLSAEGPRIDYDFGPEHEYFELLTESDGLAWYQDLSETQYLEIMAKLKLTGKVGFVIRSVDVGDHSYAGRRNRYRPLCRSGA